MIGILLAVVGIAMWVFRALVARDGSPGGWPMTHWIFAAPLELPVPFLLVAGWVFLGAAVVVGLFKRMADRITSPVLPAIVVALVLSVVVSWLFPAPGVAGISLLPLVAVLASRGSDALRRTAWVACAVTVVIVMLDTAALLSWALPRFYLWF